MSSFWGVDRSRTKVNGHVRRVVQNWSVLRSGTLIPLVVAGIAALQTSNLVTCSVRELTERGVPLDDSFFYAVLARNFDRVGYLTFDGSMPTNGVQPLWQWIVIGLQRAFPSVDVMSSSFVANWLLYALFCWLAVRYAILVHPDRNPARALVVSLLLACNPAFHAIVLRGMEVPLFLVCFCTFLTFLEHANQPSNQESGRAWHAVVLGALAATTFLARTDWFWVVLIGAVFVWKRRKEWRSVALFGVAASLLVVPYLAHNWAVHGHMMPISGRMKLVLLDIHTTGLIDYLRSDEWHGVFSMLGALFGAKTPWVSIPLVVGLVFLAVRRFRSASPSVRFLLVGVTCHTLFMHLVYREVRPYTNYYFSAEGLAAAYLLAEATQVGLVLLRRRMAPATVTWSCYAACSAAVLLIGSATFTFHTSDARKKWVWR